MIYTPTILATFILAVLLLTVSKKYFLLPFILAACFVPADQRVLILTLDFTPLRMLIVVGFLRAVLWGEKLSFKLNRFDKLVLVWAICGATIYVIQWADMRALINRCGYLFDVIGLYWLFRINIRSLNDIRMSAKILAVCSLFLAVLVGLEWLTGRNPFIIMGRVGTVVREGRYRCQASFPHSIILGLFWATLVPVFIGMARIENTKNLYRAASAAGIFIVASTSSSTPYLTLLIVMIILSVYKWRHYTRSAALITIGLIIAAQILMAEPVWSLIAKMSVVPGSTGIHRFNLINQAILYFYDWALLGCQDTSNWGSGLRDITNQYVIEGVFGGLITLVLFAIILYKALICFFRLSLQHKNSRYRFLAWCLFAMISGHCAAFLGVSYFGQIVMLWYLMLAWVAFISDTMLCSEPCMIYQTRGSSNKHYHRMINEYVYLAHY